MAKKFDIQTIFSELDKCDEDNLYNNFINIKAYITKRLEEKQKQIETEAAELKQRLEKINKP
jgi:hypothetical protein